MSDSIDISVVDRVLGGEVNAYADIIEKYQNRVFRYVYSRCGNYDEAVDITQDIFVMTYESLASFRRESKFSTWLYSIMVNYCKNHQKKKMRFTSISIDRNGEDDFEIQIADERQNTEDDIITKDMLRILKEELLELPEDHRDILMLRDIEGLSYNEIAEVLGISLANVKVRIHRGRELLKNRLQAKGVL